jgi:2-haloacid dehalogenase
VPAPTGAGRRGDRCTTLTAVEVLAFDVNETLLDLSALDPLFDRELGDASLRPAWFAQMLQLSFVGAITDRYLSFTEAQEAALRMIARRTGRALADATVAEIVGAMRELPPHPEVAGALARLRAAGRPMAALTNSVADAAEAQLENAGIRRCFDQVLSADEVRRLKPCPEPYGLVADRFGVPLSEVRLVAAHAWDVSGALAAGCSAAFVARPGMVLSPVGPQPDVVGADLDEVADGLLAG